MKTAILGASRAWPPAALLSLALLALAALLAVAGLAAGSQGWSPKRNCW